MVNLFTRPNWLRQTVLQLVCLFGLAAASFAAEPGALAAIPGVVAEGSRFELIRDGFEGTEGPLAMPDGSLIFTETRASRISQVAVDGTVSVFLTDTHGTNSLAWTAQGLLVGVQTAAPRLGVIYPADQVKIYAESFDGQPFGRPNDLVADRHGGIYFTDPGVAAKPGQPAGPPPSVYYYTAAAGLRRLVTDVARPNGIQLSRDELTLYLANTAGEYVLAYTVAEDGTLSGRRDFAKLAAFRQTETGTTSGADGLAMDAEGRLYVATALGIEVFTAGGAALGIIPTPKPPQNLAFSGVDKKTLYVVGRGAVYRLPVLATGFAGRAK
ncbi:MAG: SMP-30/gluconolactonase/LRE family protein [Verrucomicrobia bacterium]|nr:SMP-30/gluconolactonase/LRE family protein [Verrucomicrobiota bacterium]